MRLIKQPNWQVRLQHTSPVRNLSTLRLRYQVPKINNTSAEKCSSAMLLLPLPYKTLATTSLPEYVATHSPKTDYLAYQRMLPHTHQDWLASALTELDTMQWLSLTPVDPFELCSFCVKLQVIWCCEDKKILGFGTTKRRVSTQAKNSGRQICAVWDFSVLMETISFLKKLHHKTLCIFLAFFWWNSLPEMS